MKASWLTVPALAAALLAGCGDDKSEQKPVVGEDAVKKTILDWTFEPRCDLMTDKFLEEQSFVGDDRAERCKFFEDAFQKPQYSESDVKFRKIAITGERAVATVGSDIANITVDYILVAGSGGWRIDGTD